MDFDKWLAAEKNAGRGYTNKEQAIAAYESAGYKYGDWVNGQSGVMDKPDAVRTTNTALVDDLGTAKAALLQAERNLVNAAPRAQDFKGDYYAARDRHAGLVKQLRLVISDLEQMQKMVHVQG